MTGSDISRADIVLRTLTRTAAMAHEVAEALISETGQSLARWQVLDQISDGPSTVPSAARRLNQTRQSTQRVVDILVQGGLLESRENPDHRKSPLFVVSPAGLEVLADIRERIRPWLGVVGASLSPSEHEVLVEQLSALRDTAVDYRSSLRR